MLKFCNQLYDQNIRYRNIARPAATPKRNIGNEHDAILNYVLDKDADKAVDALISHYTRTGEFLEKRIS